MHLNKQFMFTHTDFAGSILMRHTKSQNRYCILNILRVDQHLRAQYSHCLPLVRAWASIEFKVSRTISFVASFASHNQTNFVCTRKCFNINKLADIFPHRALTRSLALSQYLSIASIALLVRRQSHNNLFKLSPVWTVYVLYRIAATAAAGASSLSLYGFLFIVSFQIHNMYTVEFI